MEHVGFFEVVVSAVLTLFLAMALIGCSGPLGIVVGGSDIHKLYNERIQIEKMNETARK